MSRSLHTRIDAVRQRLREACDVAGRDSTQVTLIGVTKTHSASVAAAAFAAGISDLGENRVQELVDKQPEVPGARWHLIGQLQRNKVRDVVGRDVLVHSLDRVRLANALSARAVDTQVTQRVLVQVNVGDDPAKGGCSLDEVHDLVAYARDLPNLVVEGLMTMPPLPPAGTGPDATRPHFAALRQARDKVRQSFPEVQHLSMGMSADLEAAILEGATMVRIGTALLGPRGDGPWRKDER